VKWCYSKSGPQSPTQPLFEQQLITELEAQVAVMEQASKAVPGEPDPVDYLHSRAMYQRAGELVKDTRSTSVSLWQLQTINPTSRHRRVCAG
jgi:hypothetical protein